MQVAHNSEYVLCTVQSISVTFLCLVYPHILSLGWAQAFSLFYIFSPDPIKLDERSSPQTFFSVVVGDITSRFYRITSWQISTDHACPYCSNLIICEYGSTVSSKLNFSPLSWNDVKKPATCTVWTQDDSSTGSLSTVKDWTDYHPS